MPRFSTFRKLSPASTTAPFTSRDIFDMEAHKTRFHLELFERWFDTSKWIFSLCTWTSKVNETDELKISIRCLSKYSFRMLKQTHSPEDWFCISPLYRWFSSCWVGNWNEQQSEKISISSPPEGRSSAVLYFRFTHHLQQCRASGNRRNSKPKIGTERKAIISSLALPFRDILAYA